MKIQRKTIEKGTFHTVEGKTVCEYLLQVKKEYNSNDLKKYTTTKFKEDINNQNLSSFDIFTMYGTHCMRNIIVGGRLDFNVTAKESYVSDSKSIGVHARAAFKSLFAKVNIENETVDETEQSEFENHMERNLEVYGGASEYGQNIINEGNYDAWINSISENHVFCEYGDDPFIPIWELCENGTRSAQLESDFDNWANDRQYSWNVEKIFIEHEFADTLFKRVRGDANPATGPTNPVNVESEINLLLNDAGNIDMMITYRLREQYGDHTEYYDTHIVNDIYKGSVYEIIGIEGDTSCFVGETLWTAINSWTDLKSGCSFVEDYQFLLAGLNCDNRTGVRGKLRFEVYVVEK